MAYESLKRQTTRDFEWIIVDNGSTDNTRQVAQACCAEVNFPARYVWQEDGHVKVAYNRAVREAHGELFLQLDDDDELLPEALETFRRVWFDIPEDDRCRYYGVTALCIDPAGNIVGSRFPADVFDSNNVELTFRHRSSVKNSGFRESIF